MTTHFLAGVTNVGDADQLAALRTVDPSQYHMWWDDFDTFTAANWTVTETNSGATEAITPGDGGLLLITNTAADDDLVSMQGQEVFRWASTKDLLMKVRFMVSDATQSDLLVGAAITDTSPLASLPSDGIFFYKADGSTSLVAHIRKDGTSTTLSLGAMANATMAEAALVYNAQTATWSAYFNGVRTASTTTSTNAPNDEDIAVTISLQNGEAAAKTMTVDYLMIAKQR